MRAGRLRHRITIKRNTADVDTPNDDGEVVETLTSQHKKIPAEVLEVSGGEMVRGGLQIQPTTTHLVKIRHRSGLEHRDVIEWLLASGNRTMGVTRIHDPDGRRRELLIEAEEERTS